MTCLSTAGGGCDDDRQISVGEIVTNCDSNGDGEVDPADNCTYTLAERFRYFYDDNYYYSWTASGYDGTGEGSQAVPWRINISVFVSVTMLNNTVNFTTILSGQNKNTTSCDPGSSLNDCPLWLENSGNLNISLNITGPPSNVFWSTQSISQNPNYFSIKVDRGVGEFSFDQSKSNTSYIDLPTAGVERRIVYDWDYGGEADNQADDLTIDINITAPSTEPIGSKGVKLNFTGWYPG